MKTLIIHAGMPKAGSSMIQVMLARTHEKLLQDSVDYFQIGQFEQALSGSITSGNGCFIARTLLPKEHEAHLIDDGEMRLTELANLAKASDADTGILSSEFFTNISEQGMYRLKEVLGGIGVTIKYIYFVRRQDQYLASAYIQRVKRHHYTEYPSVYMESKYANVDFLKYYSHSKKISAIFGENNILVRNFVAGGKSSGGLFSYFLSLIGLEQKKYSKLPLPIVNPSLSPLVVKAMLVMNKYKPPKFFSDELIESLSKIPKYRHTSRHVILNQNICRSILNRYEGENSALEKEFLPVDQKFVRDVDMPYVDLEQLELGAEDVLNIISPILIKLYQQSL